MHIVDFYPTQGSFTPGETITFLIELEASVLQNVTLQIFIRHFAEQPVVIEKQVQLTPGEQTIQMQWTPPAKPAGYSARLEILPASDSATLYATTAFDVLTKWTDFP